jgi:acetyl-CoA acyltransferase
VNGLRDVWVVDGLRTPVGRRGGVLAGVRPDDMAAHVLRAVVDRAGLDPAVVDDVYLGCANQAGEDNRNVARMAALLAGFPDSVPGVTVNRLCASGLEAVVAAARAIRSGEQDVCLAGGVESMSRAPYALPKATAAFPYGNLTAYDTALGWRFPNPRLAERFPLESMGETAENLADRYAIPREEQDRFALRSHRRAVAAWASGRLARETVAVPTPAGPVDRDEGPRADTSLEALARLKPAFRQGGTVTAGNSSPLNDGAAALVLSSPEAAERLGLRPRARILAAASAGVDPRYMGIGPVPAAARALDRAGLSLADMDVIELNEAFAAQVLSVLREWGISPEDDRLNPNGGAIAIGHPLGCSGARLMVTLVHELELRGGRYGLCALCVGVGQGVAAVVERLPG